MLTKEAHLNFLVLKAEFCCGTTLERQAGYFYKSCLNNIF